MTMARYLPNPTKYPNVWFFESMADWIKCMDAEKARPTLRNAGIRHRYAVRDHGAQKLALYGTERGLDEAKALVDEITRDVVGNMEVWAPAMQGAYPIVPEFLANSPTPMRARVTTASETAPITIWMSTAASAGTTSNAYFRRGISVMALVMMLMQQGRPVRLMVHGEDAVRVEGEQSKPSSFVSSVFPINTTPLDLGTALYAINGLEVEQSFMRESLYCFSTNAEYAWPSAVLQKAIHDYDRQAVLRGEQPITMDNYAQAQESPAWRAFKADAFGGDFENDLWLASAHLRSDSVRDPVKWVKDMLAIYGSDHYTQG